MKMQLWMAFLLASVLAWTGCGAPGTGGDAPEAAAEPESGGPVEPVEWMTDYEAALARARDEEKPVLMNFTGSDWCPPCLLMKREVFDSDDFARYANENLVLLELDYPFNVEQPPELVQQNQDLQQQFAIEAFPTLVILEPNGSEEKRTTGYLEGGPSVFIDWIEG